MVYRKKNGNLGFNDYDMIELMEQQFCKANNMEELQQIKSEFNKAMDKVINKFNRTWDKSIIEKEEQERKNTEELMRYWGW